MPRNHAMANEPFASPNGLHPDRMTAAERLAELAAILALGLVRLQARYEAAVSVNRAPDGEGSTGISPPSERQSDGASVNGRPR